LTLTSATWDGNALISSREDANKTKKETAMEATLPAKNTANHTLPTQNINAISLHGPAINAQMMILLTAPREKMHVVNIMLIANHVPINSSNATELIQTPQNVNNVSKGIKAALPTSKLVKAVLQHQS